MPSRSCSDVHCRPGRQIARLRRWVATGPAVVAVAVAAVVAVVAVAAGAGCGHVGGVKPHQRELLADRIMRFDVNAQERAADEHVLTNREGAVGGTGTSGGGCGCN